MPVALDQITYSKLGWLSIVQSGGTSPGTNLADDAQMWGGAAKTVNARPLTAVNDANQRRAAPPQPLSVVSLIFYATPRIITLFRGVKDATSNRFGGILRTEVDVLIQYEHELKTGQDAFDGTPASAPVGTFKDCYVDGPGEFPGGDALSEMLFTCAWTANGGSYWQDA